MYDLTSGALVRTFYDEANANHYSKNFACFGPRDDLLLNDGCLWDVRAKNMIHKFDKFNDFVSGVFHPSGLEIIINSEVVSFFRKPIIGVFSSSFSVFRTIFNCSNYDVKIPKQYLIRHVSQNFRRAKLCFT